MIRSEKDTCGINAFFTWRNKLPGLAEYKMFSKKV